MREAWPRSHTLGREEVYELGDTAGPRVPFSSWGLTARRVERRAGAGLRSGAVLRTLLPELVPVARPDARSAAPPRPLPRGVETKGAQRAELSQGGKGRSVWWSRALCSLGLFLCGGRGGEAGGDLEPWSGSAACSRILRPGGAGRRLRAQRRVVRRRGTLCSRALRRGAAGLDGAAAPAVRARGRRGWSPRGVSRLYKLWACSCFLAWPVWWCREEGSAVTAPRSEPGFRGWGGPGTAELASWLLAGRAVTIGGGGPARSRGSSPAGRSLPSQVLAAAAVGSRLRAGRAEPSRAAGRWEPAGPFPATRRRCGCPVLGGALFVPVAVAWRCGCSPRDPGPRPPGRWPLSRGPSRFAEAQVKWCHPGERGTRSEGSFCVLLLCGFLDRLRFVLRGWKFFFSELKNERGWFWTRNFSNYWELKKIKFLCPCVGPVRDIVFSSCYESWVC